jgi:acyl dehydratase
VTAFTIDGLEAQVGQEVGVSEWTTITQSRIDLFAEATGDQQWIHVDPERAVDGPYGATIAHGYLTVSLLPAMVQEAFQVIDAVRRVNYGLDKVRFPRPVVVGSGLRAHVSVRSVTPIEGGVQLGLRCVLEIEGGGKPACVAETLTLIMR